MSSRFVTPSSRPRRKGSFLAIFLYGGRQRSIAPPSGHKTRFAGFAVRTRWHGLVGQMPRQCWRVRDCWERGKCEPGVRTGFAGLHPAHKKTTEDGNSMLALVCGHLAAKIHQIGYGGKPRKDLQKLDPPGRQIRPPGTPARRCRCAPAPRSGQVFCAASRKSPHARYAAASQSPASIAG